MHERVRLEFELVRVKYPEAQHGDQYHWVLIPAYPIPPDRYNKTHTNILFAIPPGYPNTGPDNFFVDGDLRLKSGAPAPGWNSGPNSSSGPAPLNGEWGWFSWHPSIPWRPAAGIEEGDNLLTFLRGINMCLRGEEAP